MRLAAPPVTATLVSTQVSRHSERRKKSSCSPCLRVSVLTLRPEARRVSSPETGVPLYAPFRQNRGRPELSMAITYANPVYSHDFADPFVLRTRDAYYAYGTAAPGPDGRIFPVLRSSDLVNWTPLGGALTPLTEPRGFSYWAPEVAEKDGRYFPFYSASTSPSDEHHQLRVAVADDPAGPFTDSGRLLLPDAGFSIDASPFRDPRTGKWYLFFATDYEADEPHGTGLAVVELAGDLM